MKLSTNYLFSQATANFLHLEMILESAYGTGLMTANRQLDTRRADWTTEQLLSMSKAKSSFN